MKTKILIGILFTLSFLKMEGQEINSNYSFRTLYTKNGTQYKPGYKIKVISLNQNEVCFTVYKFIGDSTEVLNNTFYQKSTETNNIIVHCIPRNDFEKVTAEVYSYFKGVKAGFYTIPFKLRFDDFDFEQNINFGMNIGFQFRFNKLIEDKWLYEPSFGIGLSSIQLNTKNSDALEDRSASAFTLTSGVILHFDENINLGIFGGVDLLGNSDKDINWKHNGKPWLGIGINVGFAVSKAKESDLKNIEKPD
jgi:hypothetical protein